MTTITAKQARTRFTTLPPALQDAVFSEQTAEIIAATIEKFHLSSDRAEEIPVLVGWVLLGFLHIEDFGAEVERAARVPKPVAKDITDSLTIKIFEPLRGQLAQFHAPVPDAMTGVATAPARITIEGMSAAPKMMSETTFTATPGSQKNVIIGPKVVTEVRPAMDKSTTPTTSTAPIPGNIGKPIQHFNTKPNIGGAMATPSTFAAKPKSSGEFARLATQDTGRPSVPTPPPAILKPVMAPSAIPSTPNTPGKPMMLQNDSLPKPIQNAPDLNNSTKSTDILSGKKMAVPLPVKAATIEIGNKAKAPAPSALPATPPRTVNYGAMPTPSASSPDRHITEITSAPQSVPSMPSMPPLRPIPPAPAPMPASAPTPVAPFTPKPASMPPSQPQSPAGLAPIIVKNFTEGEK